MNKSKTNINTGRLLRSFLQKKNINNTDLGRDINRTGKSIFQYMENISIQTGILIEICHATKHNFFQDIANELPDDFTVTNDLKSPKDQMIAQLQKRNECDKGRNEHIEDSK